METGSYPVRAFTVVVTGLTKEFNRRQILRDLSFSLSTGDSLAITGKNGSGKSTLSRILAGVMSPTRGTVQYSADRRVLEENLIKDSVGFVSPYLTLYEEFTALENLQLLARIRANRIEVERRVEELLKQVNLWSRRHDVVGVYSSGMKQRLKYAFALLHNPQLLILDEPTSNLDEDGIKMVKKIIGLQRKQGVLIVATNDKNEARWCKKKIYLEGVGL